MKCDFCSEPNPTWVYPCRSFVTPDGTGESIAEWAACDRCHALITIDDWDGLAKRVDDIYRGRGLTTDLEWFRELHQRFKEHRTGPPRSAMQ